MNYLCKGHFFLYILGSFGFEKLLSLSTEKITERENYFLQYTEFKKN